MKRAYPDFWRKSFSAVLLLAVALFTGCARKNADSVRFDLISSHLEAGGSNYVVWNSESVFRVLDRSALKFEQRLSAFKLSAARKAEMQRNLVLFRLLWEISGLRDLQGAGASSVKVAPDFYRSRVFAAIPPASSGLLNSLVQKESAARNAVIGELPASVQWVLAVNISLKAVLDAIIATGDVGQQFISQIALPKNVDLSVLNQANGWAMLAFARKAGYGPEDGAFSISFPDENGEIFDAVVKALYLDRIVDKNSRRVVLPNDKGVLCHKDKKLIFYDTAAGEKIFSPAAGVPRLKDDNEFIKWNKNLPESGCAFFYIRPGVTVAEDEFLPESSVLTRTDDGILLVRNSGKDLSGEMFEILLERWQKRLLMPEKVAVQEKKAPAPRKKAAVPKQVQPDCRKNMKLIFAALKNHSAKNNGTFPAEAGAVGWNKIKVAAKNLPEDGKYLYLGYNKALAKEKNIPLLLDCGTHPDRVCVLYTDGTVRQFTLSNPGHCRRVISFLFTVHRWKMDVFKYLVKQAELLDNNVLNKE